MDACAVETDRRADIALERRTEREVAADAETHPPDFSRRDLGMFRKPVKTSTAIGIEMRDRSLCRVLLAANASGVVERDHRSRRFDPAVNFRGGGNKSISGQSYARADHWRRELKDVGIARDARILAFSLRRSDKSPHRETR